MTSVGFIGSGLMATEVARLATAAGLSVLLSNSRGPQSLAGLAAGLGPLARAVTTTAAAEADLAVLALPLGALPGLDPEPLAGRTVVDLTNYYPHRDGRIAELDANTLTTGQYVQRRLPASRVVRVFSNISYVHIPQLARPAGAPDRSALPVASDDAEAKEVVTGLTARLGFDAVDAGPLAESWRFEPDTRAYLFCYAPAGTVPETLQASKGQPLGAEALSRLLDSAERTDQSSRTF
jgi:predicted dinucleotide-binding enzyme